MMLLMPVPVYNNITEQEEDTTLALVTIDLLSILSIELNKENGYGDIQYKGGGTQETKIPFLALLDFFNRQGVLLNPFEVRCNGISKEVDKYFKSDI
jgi:hypothetical protein